MNSCTFIGHRDCPQEVKAVLYTVIEKLIINQEVREFYVGTQGQFDKYVYTVLIELEKIYDINIVVVLAYLNNSSSYYDMSKTEFPCELHKVPYRFAIKKRNEYMIRRSKFMVCYINNAFSNSYKFIEIAKKQKMQIINIGELIL